MSLSVSTVRFPRIQAAAYIWLTETRAEVGKRHEVVQLGLIPIAGGSDVKVLQWFPSDGEEASVVATYRPTRTGYEMDVTIPRARLAWDPRGDPAVFDVERERFRSELLFELDPIGDIEMSTPFAISVSDSDDRASPRQEKLLSSSSLGIRGDWTYLGELHLLRKGATRAR